MLMIDEQQFQRKPLTETRMGTLENKKHETLQLDFTRKLSEASSIFSAFN